MAGITPAVFSFSGRWVLSPANILLPICLFGYCTINLLCALSIKTIKITIATIITNKRIRVIVEIVPCLPKVRVFISALGISATIPENIIRDIPFPIPRLVICSPSHIKKTVPPVRVIVVEILKNNPGSVTTFPADSSPTDIPYPCNNAKITVPYLVYCVIFLLPGSPSFFKLAK